MAIRMRVAEPGSRETVSQEPEMRAMATRVIRTGAARVIRTRVTRARVIRTESQGP